MTAVGGRAATSRRVFVSADDRTLRWRARRGWAARAAAIATAAPAALGGAAKFNMIYLHDI